MIRDFFPVQKGIHLRPTVMPQSTEGASINVINSIGEEKRGVNQMSITAVNYVQVLNESID